MQERACRCPLRKVVSRHIKVDVRDERDARECIRCELLEFTRRHQHDASRETGDHHGDESRVDALDTPRVEVNEAEASLIERLDDVLRNQVAGDREEDIHAGEATRQCPRKRMENDH